jgi:HK97 family phage portal protein
MGLKSWVGGVISKLNPAQEQIQNQQGTTVDSDQRITYLQAFEKLESVNRGVNMIVSACASLDFDIKDKVHSGVIPNTRAKSLNQLLNFRPNPFQSAQDLRIALFTDFVLEGNAFMYFDGTFLYHLPAYEVTIVTDPKTFVAGYEYGETKFGPNEVIHFKDLSSTSIYRGSSRLQSAERSINIEYAMHNFQQQFFDNNAIPGLVFSSDNTLSPTAKEKTIKGWIQGFSPKNGARKPMIIDSGLKPVKLFESNFKELDFDLGLKTLDVKILKALGVPPVLLDGGNQANIAPNQRLFYLETVLPIINKYVSAIERFFGYDVQAITTTISALQPELRDLSQYHTGLVNGGIITPNEARTELRFVKIEGQDLDKIRVPANIAGSAANPGEGGRPSGTTQPKDD